MSLSPKRSSSFHYLPRTCDEDWSNVFPGDCVIAPYTMAARAEDYFGGNLDAPMLSLRNGILFVLGVVQSDSSDYKTFIVWSKHGVLCIIAGCPERWFPPR